MKTFGSLVLGVGIVMAMIFPTMSTPHTSANKLPNVNESIQQEKSGENIEIITVSKNMAPEDENFKNVEFKQDSKAIERVEALASAQSEKEQQRKEELKKIKEERRLLAEKAQQINEEYRKRKEAEKQASTGLEVEKEKIAKALAGTELQGLEEKVVQVAQTYKVHPYFITAVMVHESGWGKSRISKDKNNLFGLNAKDSCAYECAYTFKTKEDSVEYFASMISDIYSKKSIDQIGTKYASDGSWAKKVKNFMYKLQVS